MYRYFWLSPRSLVIASIILLLSIIPTRGIYGEQKTDEKELLQQYLTIHEIEKEIERVTHQEAKILTELAEISNRIAEQQDLIRTHKEHAGKIARAYYMGDRNDLLLLLFSANDMQELLRIYDLVSYLFEKDQEALLVFHNQVEELKSLFSQKEKQADELNDLQKHLLAQKSLVKKLDTELATLMAGLTDKEKILLLQKQLINDWEDRGIPAFDLFLRTISNSMSSMGEEFKDQVSLSLTGAKLTISDHEFTALLQKQNELFKDFRISFEHDELTFFGTYQGIVLTMIGSYQLESEEMVRFRIQQLKYNGFLLPIATANALEAEYDLGIYPRQINDRLRIKEISLTNGELKIIFTLKL